MARSVRATKLEIRTVRLKFPVAKKPVFQRIDDGISLGYRRNATAGTWVLKLPDGKGGATTKAIGKADDYDDADGTTVFTFWQAQDRARDLARPTAADAPASIPTTIGQAVKDYLAWLETKNRGAGDASHRCRRSGRIGCSCRSRSDQMRL
jgi:hypothetical protein